MGFSTILARGRSMKKKLIKRYPVDDTDNAMYIYNSEREAGLSLGRAYAANSSQTQPAARAQAVLKGT